MTDPRYAGWTERDLEHLFDIIIGRAEELNVANPPEELQLVECECNTVLDKLVDIRLYGEEESK